MVAQKEKLAAVAQANADEMHKIREMNK